MEPLKSQFKKLCVGLAIAGTIALAFDAWFPALHYEVYRVGILEPAVIDGYRIKMKPGWYQVAASHSVIGRLIFSKDREAVWLSKADWPRYGRVNSLMVYKMRQPDIDSYERFRLSGITPPSVAEVKEFPWGTVLFSISKTSAVVVGSWLYLADDDPIRFKQAISEIEGFEPSTREKGQAFTL